MTLRPEYSLGHSEYNPFLFARVRSAPHGPGAEGDDLTVLSALTRLQLDPWQEAGRLADLPSDAASRTLAEALARLPELNWQAADAAVAARRLVALLPDGAVPAVPLTPEVSAARGGAADDPGAGAQRPAVPTWLVWAVLAAAALAVVSHLQHDDKHEPPATRSWSVEQ
ncbi:MAG: hypothetical protein HYX38_34190 [Rhodospirillales bacterium]|nr:hypothetical protein [Rhodospirillales bacterium]